MKIKVVLILLYYVIMKQIVLIISFIGMELLVRIFNVQILVLSALMMQTVLDLELIVNGMMLMWNV